MLQYLPIIELLFFNSLTVHQCCEKKYSVFRTVLVIVLFSLGLLAVFWLLPFLSIPADGSLSLVGFVYIIPLRYLYRERTALLVVIMCSCWVYTLGVQAVSIQLAALLLENSAIYVFAIETLLFLATMFPFFRKVVPKFIFVLDNLKYFDRNWYRYLPASSFLAFLCLAVSHAIFLKVPPSPYNVLALLLLLSSAFMSHFMLYKIVTDAIKLNQLERAAFRDALTGLGNRACLWEQLQTLIDHNRVFSVLFMDLDRFKEINDRYGHMTGDQYLRHFARICADIMQNRGEVYRFGGDEFVAICYGAVPDSLLKQLRECREWEKDAPCPFNQVSIGVLYCRPPHQKADQILRQVDDIMYKNKLK